MDETEISQPAAVPAAASQPVSPSSDAARPGVPMIVFEDVVKVYDDLNHATGMDHVSIRIDQGEFVFLVGPSGSGKSTFIRLILKEVEADRGRVVVGGRSLGSLKRKKVPQLRRNIGCVFQDYKLLQGRTVYENVAYAMQVTGGSKRQIRQRVPEIIHMVGLADKIDSYPDELSGGQQQRVSIARALVNNPPLLIADEPTGNLDPETSAGIMELLQRIHRKGTTVVIATHDVAVVNQLRRRVIQLDHGRVVRDQARASYDDVVAQEIGLQQQAPATTHLTANIVDPVTPPQAADRAVDLAPPHPIAPAGPTDEPDADILTRLGELAADTPKSPEDRS